MNHECVAYKQRVCICLGMGKFDAMLEMSDGREHKCPVCSHDIFRANRFGFANCGYNYSGVLANGLIVNESETAAGFTEFSKSQLDWTELRIEVFPNSNVCLNN